jgi:acetylornithine deacetylase/succinyl-diaminopimelate desuccinylase-like protein
VNILRTPRPTPVSSDLANTFVGLDDAVRWLHDARDTTLARQVSLASIAAPTGAETRRGDVMASEFARAGLREVRRDAAGNVIARLPATAHGDLGVDADEAPIAPVVVLAHLDTVLDATTQPAPRVDGSRVYASGIGDNGRGLAALITLAQVLQRDTLATRRVRPIELVATVGEEGAGNLRGSRYYFDQREQVHAPSPAAVVALDGPGDALIVHHAIASRRLRFTFAGPGGHPWADPHAANAVHAVGRAVATIAALASAQPSGITITVTRMGGGESLTSVPAGAWFDLDVRTLDPRAMSRVVDAIHRLVERARAEESRRGSLSVTMDVLGDRPGGALDIMHPLVRLADAATRWQGAEPRSASASSDANIPLSRGIPAITIGAGGTGGGAHTEHEWYDDTGSVRGVARALAVVLGAARMAL